jgi:hypothetical protein
VVGEASDIFIKPPYFVNENDTIAIIFLTGNVGRNLMFFMSDYNICHGSDVCWSMNLNFSEL